MLPFGCEQLRAGKMPLGVAHGGRVIHPALIVLLLLHALLGHPRSDPAAARARHPDRPLFAAHSATSGRSRKSKTIAVSPKTSIRPPHPETIPLIAIASLQRESKINPGSDRLGDRSRSRSHGADYRAMHDAPRPTSMTLDALLRTALKSLAK